MLQGFGNLFRILQREHALREIEGARMLHYLLAISASRLALPLTPPILLHDAAAWRLQSSGSYHYHRLRRPGRR
jgi:hypothetical protein